MARRKFQEHQNRRKQPSVEISHALYLDIATTQRTQLADFGGSKCFSNTQREPKNLKHTPH